MIKEGNKKSKLNILLSVIIALILIIIVFEIIFGIMFKGIYVVQSSMCNTLIGATEEDKYGGDYVYVKLNAVPDYGDIAVVYKDEQTLYIKRVIAKGGDRVKIINGKLWIQYADSEEVVAVEEDYVDPNNRQNPQRNNFPRDNGKVIEEGHLVKEGCMFLLGDNRDVSIDSRELGDFGYDRLYGVVTDWSVEHKKGITAFYKFFHFDIPSFFGVNVKVKGIDG